MKKTTTVYPIKTTRLLPTTTQKMPSTHFELLACSEVDEKKTHSLLQVLPLCGKVLVPPYWSERYNSTHILQSKTRIRKKKTDLSYFWGVH